MRGPVAWGWCLVATLVIAGCGGGQQSSTTTETTPPADSTPMATTPTPGDPSTPSPSPSPSGPADTAPVPAVSPFDDGPRAGESAVNGALATTGEALFKTKGCVTCHTYGKRLIGPDLTGVSMRRTALWMEHQIMNPEVMLKTDPITRALFTEYKVPMTNQKVTETEAKALIEYLKRQDKKSGPS